MKRFLSSADERHILSLLGKEDMRPVAVDADGKLSCH
jgi:hypothetical protein